MGQRKDEDKERRASRGPPPNSAYMHPHDVRLQSRIQEEYDDPAPEILHEGGGFAIPASLQAPLPQRMSQEDQYSLMIEIHERLSRHPDVYRPYIQLGLNESPAGHSRSQQAQERQPRQTNTNWNFGQGQIIHPNVENRAWLGTTANGSIRITDVLRRTHLTSSNVKISPPPWRRRRGAISLGAIRGGTPPVQEDRPQMVMRPSFLRNPSATEPRRQAQVSHKESVIKGRVSKSHQSPRK